MKDDVPSKTALIVAVILIMTGSADETLVPPKAAKMQTELLKNTSVAKHIPFWLITNSWFAKFVVWISGIIVIPRFMQGLGFRKIFMETSVCKFLNQHKGKAQVLIVAGGYDTLAFRLCKDYPEVSFCEIDHPATSEQKKRALGRMEQPGNLNMIAADLTEKTLQEVLNQDSQFDKSKPTIAILEGLLFYLEEALVRELFMALSEVTGTESQVVFDYLSVDKDGHYDNGWLTSVQSSLVSKMGERWHWAINPSDLGAFLQDTSWDIKEQPPRIGLEHCALVGKYR